MNETAAATRATAAAGMDRENDAHATQMTWVFSLVRDANDWRAPIRAMVPAAKIVELDALDPEGTMVALIREAVEFFTATRAHFERVTYKGFFLGYLVTADGYRRGPAGP